MDRLRIIVTGLIGLHHSMGGVTWDYIQYAIGFRKLGHEVYYFEDSGEWPYNLDGGPNGDQWIPDNCNANIEYLSQVFEKFNLDENWAYKYPISNTWFGMSDKRRNEILKTADLLINVSGTLEFPERYQRIHRLIYIDSDPGFTQIKMHTKEFAERVCAHHVHFSFGELLAEKPEKFGIKWNPTRSPIVLSEWESKAISRGVYTTIMNWTSYKPLRWNDMVYSQKDTEFIKFLDLPNRISSSRLEVAMPKLLHYNWKSPISDSENEHQFHNPWELLKSNGWQVADSHQFCQNMDSYRSYIEHSKGEWSVAKGGYVVDKSGWFSCRSACYLAAAKPVVVQNTGFDEILPTGEGLFAFNDIDEAVFAIEQIESDYHFHSKKAKEIAFEYLDSSAILSDLIEKS